MLSSLEQDLLRFFSTQSACGRGVVSDFMTKRNPGNTINGIISLVKLGFIRKQKVNYSLLTNPDSNNTVFWTIQYLPEDIEKLLLL